jgi:RNA polymerase sigma factor (TIGR02999 family)
LFPQVYDELHRLAQHFFRGQRPDHTLQPTALVHEAYLKLAGARDPRWRDREHFYSVAAKAMRQILVNHARDRRRLKRGGGRERISLDEAVTVSRDDAPDLEALEAALEALSALDARKTRLVELRYFVGLSLEEIAELLEVSLSTVKSDWRLAKAWLLERLERERDRGG